MKPVTLVGDSPTDCVFVEKVQEKVMISYTPGSLLRTYYAMKLKLFYLPSSSLPAYYCALLSRESAAPIIKLWYLVQPLSTISMMRTGSGRADF